MAKRKNHTKRMVDNSKYDLRNMNFPSHEEVTGEIVAKIGNRPDLPNDLPKGNWTEQSLKVLNERYLVKDDKGEAAETPEDMAWRVSWEVASAESRWGKDREEVLEQAKVFYNLLISHEFLPNSPTLMNAGTGNMLQYSGCFVVPVEDSMEGIFDAVKYQALIHKTGGGTGFSFSRLRPRGARVRTSSGTASGPVSFMRIFDAATNEVKQGGKRRGANMGILRVDHPDILEFIHCKETGGITNFNISVAVTDKFMEAYYKNSNYDLIDPRDGKKVGELSAREVFDEIAESAWKTGDPGLVFIDRINKGKANPVPPLGPIESTNPCGEQPLYPFDSCNLGSIFLTYFIKNEDGKKEVDWEKLRRVTQLSVRFLDDVIEVNPYTLSQIRKTTLGIRRIGLGVGGWADMLAMLSIPYDSYEAVNLGREIMKVIEEESVEASRQLARERGPFPMFPVSIFKNEKPRRNATLTTIAPTGTISIIAGASSGIEPFFAIAFRHIVKDQHLERELTFVNPYFENVAKEKGFASPDVMTKVLDSGTIRHIEEIPQEVRAVYGTAHEIEPEWHVKMQAVFQEYTDNAVSKTINLRHEVSREDVKKAYLLAWETDCKGITIFRDGSKDAQVLNLGVKDQGKDEKKSDIFSQPLLARPFKVLGATYKLATPVGTAFVTINENEVGDPLELFINIGKAGSEVAAMAEALGRTISATLRFRSELPPRERAREIADQLAGIGGRRSVGFGPRRILSLPDAVSSALATHFGFRHNGHGVEDVKKEVQQSNGRSLANGDSQTNGHKEGVVLTEASSTTNINGAGMGVSMENTPQIKEEFNVATLEKGDICPSCGASSFVYEEGCSKCYSCAYSEC